MTMLSATTDLVNLGFGDAAILAALGYLLVFTGLIALMVVVIAIGKIFSRKKAPAPAAKEIPAAQPKAPAAPTAPGAAGELKLHNVEPKTAAMLMAIVANKMGKPLNELRFVSIKEVE